MSSSQFMQYETVRCLRQYNANKIINSGLYFLKFQKIKVLPLFIE